MMIKKMFKDKKFDLIKKFCIYHPSGNDIKNHIFQESMKMIPQLQTLILKKPSSPVSIQQKLAEIYTRFTVLYQIYSLEENSKEAGLQMLILFKELACIYSNHEDLLIETNKEQMLNCQLNAANLALFC